MGLTSDGANVRLRTNEQTWCFPQKSVLAFSENFVANDLTSQTTVVNRGAHNITKHFFSQEDRRSPELVARRL